MRVSSAGLALIVAFLAGCGGGGGGERLTKEQFLEQADAICADFEAKLDELPDPQNLEELIALAGEAQPIAAEGVARVRALNPPEELEADVDAWLDLNEENVQRIEDLREAGEAGDEERVREIATGGSENEQKADALAKKIGLSDCAREDAQ